VDVFQIPQQRQALPVTSKRKTTDTTVNKRPKHDRQFRCSLKKNRPDFGDMQNDPNDFKNFPHRTKKWKF
jgi:hypothetical protein